MFPMWRHFKTNIPFARSIEAASGYFLEGLLMDDYRPMPDEWSIRFAIKRVHRLFNRESPPGWLGEVSEGVRSSYGVAMCVLGLSIAYVRCAVSRGPVINI